MPNLLAAAAGGQHREISSNISQYKTQINLLDRETGKSPLHFAAENGHSDTVRVLIENGANPNIVNTKNQSTPLHSAAFYGHTQVIRELIRGGASINVYNSNKITPLHAGKLSISLYGSFGFVDLCLTLDSLRQGSRCCCGRSDEQWGEL